MSTTDGKPFRQILPEMYCDYYGCCEDAILEVYDAFRGRVTGKFCAVHSQEELTSLQKEVYERAIIDKEREDAQ